MVPFASSWASDHEGGDRRAEECIVGSPRPGMEKALIPERDLARIRRWVEARNSDLPEFAQGLIRYELDVTDRTVTILECRPPWRPDFGPEWTRFPIARLRYTRTRGEWSLYWRDRNLKFHEYDLVPPTPLVDDLIAEIERDPTSIFWG